MQTQSIEVLVLVVSGCVLGSRGRPPSNSQGFYRVDGRGGSRITRLGGRSAALIRSLRLGAKVLKSASKAALLDHVVEIRDLAAQLRVLDGQGGQLMFQVHIFTLQTLQLAFKLFDIVFLAFLVANT